MLHSIGAVLGGYVAMAIIVMVGTVAATMTLMPGAIDRMRNREMSQPVPMPYLAANLAISFLAAVIGGYVTGRIATTSPLMHTLALAILVLLMSAVTVMQSRGKSATGGQPPWYGWVIALIGVVGVVAGGMFAAQR